MYSITGNAPKQDQSQREKILICLGLILLLGFSIWSNLSNLTLRNAVGGFSPIEYVERITYPENYTNNFENGVLALKSSVHFSFYEAAYNAGVKPEYFQMFAIVLSVILFATVLWYFSATILPNASPYIHLLTVTFGLGTDVLNHNLARFGSFAGLHNGQMYAPAAILSVFALICAFRNKWIGCFVAIGLAFCFHATVGIMVGLICGAMLLAVPEQLKRLATWSGGILGLLIAGSWYFFIIHPSIGGYEVMDTETWVNWARFGNFHWFPFSLNVFGSEHGRRITPLLAIFILALTRLIDSPLSDKSKHMWFAATVCIIIMTFIGLLASLYPTSTTLIKLALHRSTMFLLLLSLPLALHLLLADITSDRVLNSFLALTILATPVAGVAAGFPLFFALLRLGTEVWTKQDKRNLLIYLGSLLTILALAVSLYVVLTSSAKFSDAAFVSKNSVIIFALIVVLSFSGFKWLNYKSIKDLTIHVVVLFCVLFVSYKLSDTSFRQKDRALAYLDVQLWAKENTQPNTLFMTEPSRAYGWRDYSQRPSFGVAREWLHTTWLYTGNMDNFREGMQRAQLFGVNPEDYLQRSLENDMRSVGPEYRALISDISERYNSMEPNELYELSVQEGIDYFVYEKSLQNNILHSPVYSNEFYAVYNPKMHNDHKSLVISTHDFTSSLPIDSILSQQLTGDLAEKHGWINIGWRGEILVSGVEDDPGVMRLVAGKAGKEYDGREGHVLLLRPVLSGSEGLEIPPGAEFVEFESEFRCAHASGCGTATLRLDLNTPGGWNHRAGTTILGPSEEWTGHRAKVSLKDIYLGISPIIAWRPASQGDILEIRNPRLMWGKFVEAGRDASYQNH